MNTPFPHLLNHLQHTPEAPGIYKMLDKQKNIIYIGKAKNLKKRVSSYFQKNISRKITRILVQQINSFDVIVTDSEKDALILEDHLIKKNQPFFNIELKDNKTYPYLWLTTIKGYPRLLKTRTRPAQNQGYLFGPYTNVQELNLYIEIIHSLYPLKKCSQEKFPPHFKPCLYYDIGQCLDYCTNGVSKEDIKALLEEIKKVISGSQKNKDKIITVLQKQLQREIDNLNFEKAKIIKEKITLIEQFNHQQKILLRHENNFDIVETELSGDYLIIVVLEFRLGKLTNKKTYECFTLPESYEQEETEQWIQATLENFIISYYSDTEKPILEEVIIPKWLQNTADIQEKIITYLKSHLDYHFTFKIKQPQRGKKSNLLKLAKANAKLSYSEIVRKKEKEKHAQELKKILRLSKKPRTIESFDIANTASQAIIAGMVRFVDGEKDKSNYRLFNIKNSNEQDDFAAMSEAVYRRYKRLLEEKEKFPDIILIDGGKGQLSAAKSSLERLGIYNQPIISLAKREEEIFLPKRKEPLSVDFKNPALLFLILIRNETHRFVNSSHRKKRDQLNLVSILNEIPNIGTKKKQILNMQFESLSEIKNATKEEICRLPYFSEKDFLEIQISLKRYG